MLEFFYVDIQSNAKVDTQGRASSFGEGEGLQKDFRPISLPSFILNLLERFIVMYLRKVKEMRQTKLFIGEQLSKA